MSHVSKHKHCAFDDGEASTCRLHEYLPKLTDVIESCDLVISHCGAGSVFEALSLPSREQRRALIVIPNPALMDNHQAELAELLEQRQWAVRIATAATVVCTTARKRPRCRFSISMCVRVVLHGILNRSDVAAGAKLTGRNCSRDSKGNGWTRQVQGV